MPTRRLCILCPIIAALLALLMTLTAPRPAKSELQPVASRQLHAAEKPVSFMDDVAPILKENCFGCHNAKVKKAKFDMTTFETFAKGGDLGEPFVAGKPEESNLYMMMTGEDAKTMPPKEAGGLLPKEKVELIGRWIKEGVKFDGPAPDADLALELRKRWKPTAPPAVYKFPSIVNAVVFTPDNKQVVTGGLHELLVWDVESGKLEKRVRTRAERALAMVFLSDGKTLAVAGGRPGQEGDVRLYDLDAGKPIEEKDGVKVFDGLDPKAGVLVHELIQVDDQVLCLAISSDGKKLAAGGCDKVVRVWDLDADYKLVANIETHGEWVCGIAFAPDGDKVLTASRDRTVKVFDVAANELLQTFPDHREEVYTVAIKPDGKVGVSGGKDNQVRFWNVGGNGRQLRNPTRIGNTVWRVLWHQTKNLVYVAAGDKSVRVINAANGRQDRNLQGHSDQVYALALSSDGGLLASGSYDGEVRIWKAADGSLLKAFIASPGHAK